MTEICGRFEWDTKKNADNIAKHGFPFKAILSAFDDPCFLERFDREHSIEEDRYLGLGKTKDDSYVIVLVSYTERERIRIISARIATPKEENIYNENCRKLNS